jgi:lipopolysaccharide export LptBFGC system permease protein LptF
MRNQYPEGRKPVQKWVITLAFAIAVVCLSGTTNANAQSAKPTSNNTTNTCEQQTVADSPSTMGFRYGDFFGFDGGYASLNSISPTYTIVGIVGKTFDTFMVQITGKTAPTVAVNDPELSPCSAIPTTNGISGGAK